ncbi:MAG: hypothetical protein FWC72_07160, partial [Oscillospiraceae bacterium]|nr:hypothetical protein [Oscillospiraceae bacterium]
VLTATIWNMSLIIFFVLSDQLDYYILNKMKAKDQNQNLSTSRRILKSYLAGPSVKSTLYLLYMFILVCTAILAAAPDFSPWLRGMSGYFQSMQYGILLLIASDKFFAQLFKDMAFKDKVTSTEDET